MCVCVCVICVCVCVSTLFHSFEFSCQQRVLKTFPDTAYLRISW